MATDNLFDTNKKYRTFAIFGNISAFILLVLVTINLLLGFIAYVSSQLFNYHLAQFFELEDISFIRMFEMLYLNDMALLRNVFIIMSLAFIVACISFYSMNKIEKSQNNK